MSFIDDLLLIVNDIKVEFDHQAYIKQAFFYKYIINRINTIDIFNFHGDINKQKQILIRKYPHNFKGYICIKNDEVISYSKISYYSILKVVEDNDKLLKSLLDLVEAFQCHKQNKFVNSVNDTLIEHGIIKNDLNQVTLERVKNDFFEEFSKLSNIHIFFFIPVQIAPVSYVLKHPYKIDYFELHKHQIYNFTEQQLANRFIHGSFAYNEDICYIDFFELFNENFLINDYITEEICIDINNDHYIGINILSEVKIDLNLILNFINKNYFDMIIEQQKFIFSKLLLEAEYTNSIGHTTFENLVRKNYKAQKKNQKKYKLLEESKFDLKTDCVKEIIKLANELKTQDVKQKYSTNKLKYIQNNLSKKCHEEFDYFAELKFSKNAYSFHQEVLNKIPKKFHSKLEFKFYKKLINIIFGQYMIVQNEDENIIKLERKIMHIKVEKRNEKYNKNYLKNKEIIHQNLDLFYLRKMKSFL